MVFQDTIKLAAQERGATDITDFISDVIQDSKIKTGTCQLFVHNSLSCLLIYDTADEAIKDQTADFLAQLAPSSDGINDEIDNSMDAIPEAMRAALTQTTIAFPISHGKPLLGTWQGIYLWERTTRPKARKLTITIIGE
ncbi:MAG: YjbQ family protein [Proteobacteria bacterium]|nr:YjbQ family protein [Pseudomonadota bacterium]